MKKNIIFLIILLVMITSSVAYASTKFEEVHNAPNKEMNGTIVDKDVSGKLIDYLIEINGTKCWLSCQYQPYAEYNIGDNVTMNGTVIDAEGYKNKMTGIDFDGKYKDQELPIIRLHMGSVNGNGDYGQMRLTSDINDQNYINMAK